MLLGIHVREGLAHPDVGITLGGAVAHLSPNRAVQVLALARNIA